MQSSSHPENLSALAIEAKTDPAAFARLYDHYVQPVYRYLYSRVETVHAAEDLTSQTFIAAFEALPRYREDGHFAAWLFQIARNKLTDYFRGNRLVVSVEAAERHSDGEDLLDQVIRDEETRRLAALIKSQEEGERDLIRLRYAADLSFAAMADLLGKREDAVRKSVYRLLARLKAQLE